MNHKKVPFYPADILLPKNINEKWSVIACDQFTSEPEYWNELDRTVADAPSALRIILPEAFLGKKAELTEKINGTMKSYLKDGIFTEYKDSMVLTERRLPDGKVRMGIIGALDLEEYDFSSDSKSLIRATEQTVLERIPPRVEIRRSAEIELPHVLVLYDDPEDSVIGAINKDSLPLLYDYDLIGGGGHIRSWLLGKENCNKITEALGSLCGNDGMLFAVGDGNHSLAAAKSCYEQTKIPLQRYALVEICNLRDASLEFEPIYRVLFGTDADSVKASLDAYFSAKTGNKAIYTDICFGEKTERYTIENPIDTLCVANVESFVQDFLKNNANVSVDYVHGTESVRRLCKEKGAVGLMFPGMKKEELFGYVLSHGVLPRKTFSMGEALSKRYYTEARKIK